MAQWLGVNEIYAYYIFQFVIRSVVLFGAAASAGLVSQMRNSLITDLAGVYEVEMSEQQLIRIRALINGAGQAGETAGKIAVRTVQARTTTQLSAMSKKVAASSSSSFAKYIPILGN